jgi:hypothetical protein
MSLTTRSSREGMSTGSDGGRRDLRRAWTSLGLLLGFVIGAVRVMNSLTWDPSFWAAELVLVASVAVVPLLAAGAVRFGRRARAKGEEGGRIPIAIGFAVGGLSLGWALLPIAGHLAGFE